MTGTDDMAKAGGVGTGGVAPPPEPPREKGGASRGIRIALGVSLALNLLVIGAVAGALLRDGPPRERLVRDLDFGPFTEALSPSDREALRDDFVARMPDLRDTRRAMRADLDDLLVVLRAEPFDVDLARRVMQGQRERMEERILLGQDLMLERLAQMSPAARQGFADRLERRLRRGPLTEGERHDRGGAAEGEGHGQGRDEAGE